MPRLTHLQKVLWGIAGAAVLGYLGAIAWIDNRIHSWPETAGEATIRADFRLTAPGTYIRAENAYALGCATPI